jgi:UDP-N-acetylmuramate dehydrogenase
MLNIEKNHKLAQYTTFKAGDTAQYFAVIKDKDDLIEAIAFSRFHKLPLTILGGGSNILFSGKVKGLVIKNEIKGIRHLYGKPIVDIVGITHG